MTETESTKDMLSRLKLIASGDRDCDMSDNDLAALRWLVGYHGTVPLGEAGSSAQSAAPEANSSISPSGVAP